MVFRFDKRARLEFRDRRYMWLRYNDCRPFGLVNRNTDPDANYYARLRWSPFKHNGIRAWRNSSRWRGEGYVRDCVTARGSAAIGWRKYEARAGLTSVYPRRRSSWTDRIPNVSSESANVISGASLGPDS